MNRDNIKGIQMWRDDEVEHHPSGTKTIRERYFIRSQCSVHSESDPNNRYGAPATIILETKPYRQSTHLTCIEARMMLKNEGEPIDCKNVRCPFYNDDFEMNQTNYHEIGMAWVKEQWDKHDN